MAGLPPRRTRGYRVIAWIEANCVHTQGEWIGRPFRLLAWQKTFLLELFELVDGDVRRFRWALLGVAKKAGKTELAAAVALYLLIGDGEPSPLGACAAASEEQADLVFGACKTMCSMSPTLRLVCDVYEKEILVPSIPGAKLRRVAAAAGTNDGPSYSFVVIDELHEWGGTKGEQVWTVLTNSTGARRQPLILQITTAGVSGADSILERQYQHALEAAAGEAADPTYYFRWYSPPPGADYRSEEAWKAANPSYGVITHRAFYEDQLLRKPEGVFRRYFCNEWTQTTETWLPAEAWAACAGDAEIPDSSVVAIGVDVGLVNDSTAVAWAYKRGDGKINVRCHVWSARRETASHTFVPGKRVQLEPVEEFIRELAGRYTVAELCFDPRFFERSAQMLSNEGMTVVSLEQSSKAMADAYQGLFEAVTSGRIEHPNDPVLNAHVASTAAELTDRGWKVRKLKQGGHKIDALVAMVMATYRAETAKPRHEWPLIEILL
jgi:phage terminase large subunit-like protein